MEEKEKMLNDIIEELGSLRDDERKEWSGGYYPSSMRIIGIKVPDQREVSRRVKKRIKKWAPGERLGFAKELVATDILECQQVAYEILDRDWKVLEIMTENDLMDLAKGLDNWISVDTFSSRISGVLWRMGRVPDESIMEWAASDDRWWRRTALVSTIALNQRARGGEGDVERTLMVCEVLADDKDDMVAKALSWALRELSKRHPGPVRDFMDRHDDHLPKRVKREVSRKLETGKKNG